MRSSDPPVVAGDRQILLETIQRPASEIVDASQQKFQVAGWLTLATYSQPGIAETHHAKRSNY